VNYYRLFWIGAFVSIIAVALPKFGAPGSAVPLDDYGRNGSVNSVLNRVLDQPHCAESIAAWLNALPPGRGVLVIAQPNSNPASLASDLIPYLAWPRVVTITSDLQTAAAEMHSAPDRYCAIGFCYVSPPPGMPVAKSFGPALSFVTLHSK